MPLLDKYVFLVPYFLATRSFVLYDWTCDVCLRFRGCPVELDLELSVSAWHQKTRLRLPEDWCGAVRAASCAAACCRSSERRFAAPISKLDAMRAKQSNEFGPIRAPENNDFWRPTTAKLPLPFALGIQGTSTPCGLIETHISPGFQEAATRHESVHNSSGATAVVLYALGFVTTTVLLCVYCLWYVQCSTRYSPIASTFSGNNQSRCV